MKIVFILLLTCIGSSFATETFSQNARISFSMKNATFRQIFDQIEAQTHLDFIYSDDFFNDKEIARPIKVRNKSFEQILDLLFEGTEFRYKVIEDQVIIARKQGIGKVDPIKGAVEYAETTQDKVIKGKVTDKDGAPIPGVSIVVTGTTIGGTTDVNGEYSLSVPNDAISLRFSFIGLQTKEIFIENRATIDVVLESDAMEMDEIVVVGYGAMNKKDLTGAVVALKESDMTIGGNVASVSQMMQGRAAGVEVFTESSEPGADLSVVVRGLTSIGNTNQPLYVVDGFPMSAGVTLNPSDIERIDILKDASATAIYGSRGSAGVIMITTKKGERGQVHVSYDSYVGVQKISNPIEFLNWNDYARGVNIRWEESPAYDNVPFYSAADIALGTLAVGDGTNWLEEGTRNAAVQNHQISLAGGDDKTRFSLSGNYFDQEGILLKSKFSRGSVRFNFDRKIGEKVNIGANIYTQQTKSNAQKLWPGARNSSVMYKLLTNNPGRPAYNADGSLGQITFSRDLSPWTNPIGQMTVPDRDISGARTYVNLWADFEIIEGLVAKLNVGYDQSASTSASYVPGIYTGEYAPESQQAEIGESKSRNSLIEGTITYKTTFAEVHALTVLGGASTQYFDAFSFGAKGIGYPTDKTLYYDLGAAAKGTTIRSFRSDSRLISAFARANYNFKEKYLLTATIRSDGDSKFGANNKWGVFPSASAAWRISEEDFLNNSNLIDNLKLRVGYGVTGNNSFGAYTALARIGASGPFTFDGINVVTGLGAADSFAPNPNLKWETSNMLNIGLDFGLWRSRLTGSIEVYNTDTKDIILDKNISKASTGYTKIRANVGEINNKGIELTLGGDIIDNEGLRWNFSANMSKNINKVIKLDGDNIISISSSKAPSGSHGAVYTRIVPGEPIGNFYGYIYKGVLGEGETYGPQPTTTRAGSALYEDLDGSGLIDSDDRTILGNATPDFIYGINNRLSYKGFSLDMFFQGVHGNELFNVRRVMIDEANTPASLERYSASNTTGTLPGTGYFYSGSYGSYVNDYFIEDGSYLRLKNVVFTYKFDTSNISWLNNVEVYVSGQNLITWTNYTGFDPEVSFESGNGIGRGVDDNGYPNVRNYTGGLRVTF